MSHSSSTIPVSHRPKSIWRFSLPLLLQVALVLTIPAQAAYTYFAGSSVILQTVPVDPYSLLQGYYVTLRYDISQLDTLNQLPGWSEIEETHINADTALLEGADSFYVIMEEPGGDLNSEDASKDTSNAAAVSDSPPAWIPVRVLGDRPSSLPDHQIALEGYYSRGQVRYGLEKYFIPEEQRDEINNHIRETQDSGNPQAYVVEVRVMNGVNAVPKSLWIGEKNYRF